MLEYYGFVQSQLPKTDCMPDELLQEQLEVDKDLMTHKMQMEDRQKIWKVAKEALSKLLFHIQELRAAIENQKAKWDIVENNNFNVEGGNLAHSKGAPMGDALKASKTKPFEFLIALKYLESKELQISKKVGM